MSVQMKHKSDHSTSLALLLSISPLYFLVQAKSRLGLDNLHISLLQVFLLFALRWILSFNPRAAFRSKTQPATTAQTATRSTPVESELEAQTTQITDSSKTKHKKKSAKKPAENPLYPRTLLDGVVTNFLSVTESSYATLLPSPPSSISEGIPSAASLSTWTSLHQTENLQVLQHPTAKALYAICSVFPDVPLRKLFATLVDIEKRKEWDGMCSGVEPIEEVNVGGRRGAVSWLGMKGMALVKPKDLVLLSMAGRLPPPKSGEPNAPLRIFCATRSIDHPKCPPKPGFNRMVLTISGFIAEESGDGGSKVTQITDLSGLGSWVPSSVIKVVTQTMIPKSLVKLGQTAAAYDLSTSTHPIEGDEWLPPLLGAYDQDSSVAGSDDGGESDEDDDGSDLESDEEGSRTLTPSASRDLHTLVGQIKTLTLRLSEMETTKQNAGGWAELLTSRKLGLVGTGSAVGAAVAVAAIAFYNRRRR
ncbi:Bet v1-like protein [Meredithblackwellia eburnea MCA 4105]